MPQILPSLRLTDHAIERGQERLGLRPESLLRQAANALERGMPMAETRGDLWRWLENRMLAHGGRGGQTCIHADVVYIIDDGVLVTVILLPAEHRPQMRKWLAKNGAGRKSSGNLKDPRSGVETLKTGQGPLKSGLRPLKSAPVASPRSRKWHQGEDEEP